MDSIVKFQARSELSPTTVNKKDKEEAKIMLSCCTLRALPYS